ncbi:MAG: hypothetical protein A3E78_09805 [Alphaproteobacteria bacterium RIFCSPHIGHO2_12_FULL_63_12]|nr:MAG: hypothetical protein A3E78_09805 [Alphaproteobacteria bacterium RIFCSPHIGHO2_12_FULL_63_12]
MSMRKNSQAKIGPAEPGFVLEEYVLYNLVLTTATYNEEMSKALKKFNLDTMKWRTLMLLDDKSPCSVGELARRSVTKMPTLTRVLIRMEDEGLIVRQALAGDKRVVQVTMTPKAVSALRAVQKIGQKVFERAFEGVDASEIAGANDVLQRMRSNLGRSPYESGAPEQPPKIGARAS